MPPGRNAIPAKHGRDHRRGGADPIPPVQARMPHVNLRVNMAGVTIVNGADQQISFDTFLAVPINNGGAIDSSVFELEGSSPYDHINILQPGVYWGSARVGWWTDWGAARVNLNLSWGPGGGFEVSDSYGYTTSLPTDFGSSYPGGVAGANQVALHRHGYIMVDEYATDVQVYCEITNSGGSDRTPNGRTVGAQMFLIQLAGSGHSNPPG